MWQNIFMNNYESSAHCKYLLKYHMVFVTKYRKSILIGDFDTYIKTVIKQVSVRDDSLFTIDILETDRNHRKCTRKPNPFRVGFSRSLFIMMYHQGARRSSAYIKRQNKPRA